MTKFESGILRDLDRAGNQPCKYSCNLMGDLNLDPIPGERIQLTEPITPWSNLDTDAMTAARNVNSSRPWQKRWEVIFGKMTEIKYEAPNHVNIQNLSLNKINRTFTSFARSSITMLAHKAGVDKDPCYWYTKLLSDHSPIYWKISLVAPRDPGTLTIKPEWAKHEVYQKHVDATCKLIEWEDLEIQERSALLKDVYREAGKLARDAIFQDTPGAANSILWRMCSISRAVYQGNPKLASILIDSSELGKKHLDIAKGKPILRDPKAFEEDFANAKKEHLENAKQGIIKEHDDREAELGASGNQGAINYNKAKRNARLNQNSNKSELWIPVAPRLVLGGACVTFDESVEIGIPIDPNAETTRDGKAITDNGDQLFKVMQHVWGGVFKEATIDEEASSEILREYLEVTNWDWSRARHPTRDIETLSEDL